MELPRNLSPQLLLSAVFPPPRKHSAMVWLESKSGHQSLIPLRIYQDVRRRGATAAEHYGGRLKACVLCGILVGLDRHASLTRTVDD